MNKVADKKQALLDFVNDRHNTINMLIGFRVAIIHFGISRKDYNRLVYDRMKRDALERTARYYAWDKCCVKGHDFKIASGYQSLWDNGVDVPVQCKRCGHVEM